MPNAPANVRREDRRRRRDEFLYWFKGADFVGAGRAAGAAGPLRCGLAAVLASRPHLRLGARVG
ncbi:MAG: hypothetical protein LCH98_18135 [Actinobacteria bacterium]|nr:hypothetical protein [Actinomycetota bacterium]